MMNGRAKAPTHLWIVGILSLLWNCFGVADYILSQTRNEAWLANFTAEQRAFIDSFPAWMEACWAFGVWGALLGSILLLARSRFAVAAFAVSLAGLAAATAGQYAVLEAPAMSGVEWGMTAAIWVIEIALLYYATRMRARGVLG